MPYFHEFDYIFAFGVIFAFLDAWNIGANDVANAFATSVSSRSLTMAQAMMIATFMEFGGAMGVGGRVAETIRKKIVDPALFADDPAILMLGMTSALVGSSIYMTFATKLGMPVSTTHSTMGGVIGMAIATVGAENLDWGWNGISQVFAAWAIAPALAGAFGAVIFSITKYGVMMRKNPVKAALVSVPFYFALTTGLLVMLIVWKGIAARVDPSDAVIIGSIFGSAGLVALLVCIFFIPYLIRKLVQDDWTLKSCHILLGPFLLSRGPVPPRPTGASNSRIKDYYRGHKTQDQIDMERNQQQQQQRQQQDGQIQLDSEKNLGLFSTDTTAAYERNQRGLSFFDSDDTANIEHQPRPHQHEAEPENEDAVKIGPRPEGPVYSPRVLWWLLLRAFFHGVNQDVVGSQQKDSLLASGMEEKHARAQHYDNKAEHVYSSLQVMTAATASFTHGANDVSNAVGPFATIYAIWSTTAIPDKAPVEYWILAFGGGAIVLGLWTYGYNIMRNLGNRITLHSPSRGFSMELGSAVTVVMATRLALPVSTTQCITGATVGVGLCNGDWRTINWRMVAWIYFGWFITLPVTGLISGCLMGIIINAPRFGYPS